MLSLDQLSQGLKFVDVTPRYLRGTRNSEEQKSIRVHVMQDFLRQKKLPIDTTGTPTMAGTVSGHVHRFRIAKPRLREDEAGQPTEPVSSRKAVAFPEQDHRSTLSRKLAPNSTKGSLASQPSQSGTLCGEEKAPALLPRIMPNLPGVTARMDPFARLPIDGSIQTHEILDYCELSVLLLSAVLGRKLCILKLSYSSA